MASKLVACGKYKGESNSNTHIGSCEAFKYKGREVSWEKADGNRVKEEAGRDGKASCVSRGGKKEGMVEGT